MPPREPGQDSTQFPGPPQQQGPQKTKLAEGWTAEKSQLGYETRFRGKNGDVKQRLLAVNEGFQDLRPVYANPESSLFIIEVTMKAGGNRYYVWNDISDELFELPGSLDQITEGLSEPAGPAAT